MWKTSTQKIRKLNVEIKSLPESSMDSVRASAGLSTHQGNWNCWSQDVYARQREETERPSWTSDATACFFRSYEATETKSGAGTERQTHPGQHRGPEAGPESTAEEWTQSMEIKGIGQMNSQLCGTKWNWTLPSLHTQSPIPVSRSLWNLPSKWDTVEWKRKIWITTPRK